MSNDDEKNAATSIFYDGCGSDLNLTPSSNGLHPLKCSSMFVMDNTFKSSIDSQHSILAATYKSQDGYSSYCKPTENESQNAFCPIYNQPTESIYDSITEHNDFSEYISANYNSSSNSAAIRTLNDRVTTTLFLLGSNKYSILLNLHFSLIIIYNHRSVYS